MKIYTSYLQVSLSQSRTQLLVNFNEYIEFDRVRFDRQKTEHPFLIMNFFRGNLATISIPIELEVDTMELPKIWRGTIFFDIKGPPHN